MSTTSCPTCGKPVDSLRAPAAKIRDGKIVGYCSKECATAADTKPTAQIAAAAAAAAAVPSPSAKSTGKQAAMKIVRRTPSGGVPIPEPRSARDFDSGPVIEIIKDVESAPVAAKEKKAEKKARSDETDGAIQIADTGSVDDYVDPEPRRSGKWIAVVVLLLAGGALAAYSLGAFDKMLGKDTHAATSTPKPAPAPTPAGSATAPAAMQEPLPPRVSPAEALDKAKGVLKTLLKSASPRVQRVAAAALSRTNEHDAIDLLAAALTKEDSELSKLEIAYALARTNDRRGTDALVSSLQSQRRDVKAEAARLLALLGDKRAVPVLSEYLDVAQLRLGAAEQLAYVADPKALEVLESVRKDDKATPDDKARATIALGIAGKAEVTDDLRKLLTDARQNAFAANALAMLHDPAARPVLVKQLAIPSLRVRAARALRKLEPNLDAGPLVGGLVDTLASAKDTEQAQAAEAVLLLAGPGTWSERE